MRFTLRTHEFFTPSWVLDNNIVFEQETGLAEYLSRSWVQSSYVQASFSFHFSSNRPKIDRPHLVFDGGDRMLFAFVWVNLNIWKRKDSQAHLLVITN